MSGGYFDYADLHLYDLALEVESAINPELPEDIRDRFAETALALQMAYQMTQCVDYLLEEDYGNQAFREAWREKVIPLLHQFVQEVEV